MGGRRIRGRDLQWVEATVRRLCFDFIPLFIRFGGVPFLFRQFTKVGFGFVSAQVYASFLLEGFIFFLYLISCGKTDYW
jgi:hypothetical protein